MVYLKVKRSIDIVLSFLALIILSPVFLILIIAIKIDIKGPALLNQYDSIEERDKYSANDAPVGPTSWAQINGRDEFSIDVKDKFDGEYVEKRSFLFDCKCFFVMIGKVPKLDGVVEGGSGRRKGRKRNENSNYMSILLP